MDIRGIEITNQLRSAIRAKLLELGVRYDEELPDYILVMVVNKKSRQQMHEDLFLFLEDSTTPFVEWLHDQVLKKLQKVTVAKRKSGRDLVPSVVVKQEEEKKKRKTATSFLDDQISNTDKDDKETTQASLQLVSSTTSQELDKDKTPEQEKITENHPEITDTNDAVDELLLTEETAEPEVSSSKDKSAKEKNVSKSLNEPEKRTDLEKRKEPKQIEEKRQKHRDEREEDVSMSDTEQKIKSSVKKPRINSVVSVKNRLGSLSNNESDNSKNRGHFGARYRPEDKRPNRYDSGTSFSRSRGFRASQNDSSNKNDLRSRLTGNVKQQDINFSPNRTRDRSDIRERLGQGIKSSKIKEPEKPTNTVKGRSVKNRLGPVRNYSSQFNDSKMLRTLSNVAKARKLREQQEDNEKIEDEEEEEEEVIGPVKSRIIAVKKPEINKDDKQDEEEEESVECKVPSKVIVTPRPLKPLQPTQKRATQSLLLRAVAEANQSVVMQKNPEPSLTGKRPAPVRLRTGAREIGNNLMVCINQRNRLVMEEIQVELTADNEEVKSEKNLEGSEDTEEHLNIVKSLFHNDDDNRTFLVTLSGYDNKGLEEEDDEEEEGEGTGEQEEQEEQEEEEGLEMEVNENDEMTLSNSQIEYAEEEEEENNIKNTLTKNRKLTMLEFAQEAVKILKGGQNNENSKKQIGKKRKLSPIIYTRSPSPRNHSIKLESKKIKKPMVDSNVVVIADKPKEKCRYWPNCTVGNKCAYYHPSIICSAFPACKFGDKCAYQHPKCKFGISCTKPGCVFSHPPQQCKYHPFCAKPGCTFSHPSTKTPVLPNMAKERAKFTWRRQD